MALPSFCSLGRPVSSRLFTPCFSAQIIAPRRAFASSSRLREASAVNHGDKLPKDVRQRSIAILKLPKQTTKNEVESLIKNAGYQITKSQLRLDRFTLYNDTFYFAELANEEQAKDAVQKLDQSTTLIEDHPIYLRTLDPKFIWKSSHNKYSRWIYHEGSAISKAVLPLKEGRRVQVRVRTPGWKPAFDAKPSNLAKMRMNYGQDLVAKSFDRFGIEAIGSPAHNDGRMLPEPKFFCQIDFKTKEGAEEAVRAMHNTEIEGKLIWVTKSELNEVRSRQIGRVDMGVLKELQGLGLAVEVDFEK